MYKKGVENSAANALSRRPHSFQIFHISRSCPVWLEDIVASYSTDDKAIELLQQLAVDPSARPNFQLLQGLLRYKGCIWVGNNVELHDKTFSAFMIVLLVVILGFLSPTTESTPCSDGMA